LKPIPVIISCIFAVVAYTANFPQHEVFVILLCTYFIFDFIDNFGKSIWQILDLMIISALTTWTLAPLAAYHYFNDQNHLAVLWDKTMRVDSITYYSFVLPAVIALIFGIKAPFLSKRSYKFNIDDLRRSGRLNRPPKVGYNLLGISFLATLISPLVPASLAFVVFLLNKLSVVGILYLYFSGKKSNNLFLILAMIIVIIPSIRSGMFGEMVYLFILGGLILSQGNRLTFIAKSFIFVGCIFSIILLQSIKGDFRKVAWSDADNSNNSGYFISLLSQRILSPNEIYKEDILFNIIVRSNQGWLISATMDNIPKAVPFSNGKPIWLSIMGSIVPRFLWPDKPKSGGAANLKMYLGWELKGTSMNVSPLGEAWANFGWLGGIFYMFLYGLFFRIVFGFILKLISQTPTLIIWLPLLFMYVVVTESDVLSNLNHLTKSSIFIFIMYKAYRSIFKISL